jgi:DNA-3-methyladenine glycosylase II
MTFTLIPDGPLDVDHTLARFRVWGDDPANRLRPGRFCRAIRVGAELRGYLVTWQGGPGDVALEIRVPGPRREGVTRAVRGEVEKIFGLTHDLAAFYRFTKGDPVLGPLAERLHGFRPTLSPAPLEMLVGAVCAQQVNLTFASTLRARLVTRYGTPVAVDGETVYAFPDGATLARVPVVELRAMQFSARKAEYVIGLAQASAAGGLRLEDLVALDNAGVVDVLTRLRGLGRWSAEWFLARCLGRGDVCPAGDLAVRRAFSRYYHRGRAVGEVAIRRRARAWGAHQSLAVHYLLAGLRLAAPTGGGA